MSQHDHHNEHQHQTQELQSQEKREGLAWTPPAVQTKLLDGTNDQIENSQITTHQFKDIGAFTPNISLSPQLASKVASPFQPKTPNTYSPTSQLRARDQQASLPPKEFKGIHVNSALSFKAPKERVGPTLNKQPNHVNESLKNASVYASGQMMVQSSIQRAVPDATKDIAPSEDLAPKTDLAGTTSPAAASSDAVSDTASTANELAPATPVAENTASNDQTTAESTATGDSSKVEEAENVTENIETNTPSTSDSSSNETGNDGDNASQTEGDSGDPSPQSQTETPAETAEEVPEPQTEAPEKSTGGSGTEEGNTGETGSGTNGEAGGGAGAGDQSGGGDSNGGDGGAAGAGVGGGGNLPPPSAEEDPNFQAVKARAKGAGKAQGAHAPAEQKAGEFQAAAVSPQAEVEGQAQDIQMGEMQAAETPAFDAVAFKEKLMKRIRESAPKTLGEADDFKEKNKLGAAKNDLQNTVAEEKEQSQGPVAEETEKSPDTSQVTPKPVTPLPPADPGAPPPAIGAEQAVPPPRDPSQVEAPLAENSQSLDNQMSEANVTEDQLANSNEPTFNAALSAKKEAQTHAVTAGPQVRQTEQQEINQAQGDASTVAAQQLTGMHGDRTTLLNQVAEGQNTNKSEDEKKREEVATKINQIYEDTKKDVEEILSGLDKEVKEIFEAGANRAQAAFENYVEQQMDAYKDRRYDGVTGWGRWVKDKIMGMPSEVNVFYARGRDLYIQKMDAVLNQVVSIVGTRLTQAKARIAQGKQEVANYVAQQPQELQQIAQQAANDFQSKFDELEQNVDAKQDELIDSIAQQYNDRLQAIDARIEEMKAANQGLVDMALNAVAGVIATIKRLRDMLLNVLAKAGNVIDAIISDPIGFLGNLIAGLKQGFMNFVGNILTHLQTGLIGWLTGALGPVGITIPDDLFSLPGIFDLVMQILGLGWDFVRAKAVKLFGEPVVTAIEKGLEIFQVLMNDGIMGLWEYIKESFNNLKEMVIEQIKSMIISQVVKAGIKWIMGLLNPAGAFVKACMLIYDIVMFFVNRGSQIMELVNSILDAIGAIAAGNIGAMAAKVEQALAKAVPVLIGFLASLLGISGLAKKVQGIIMKVRGKIDKAVDKLLMKVKKMGKKFFGKFKKKPGDDVNETNDPEHDAKVNTGLSQIDQEEKKYTKGRNKISKEDAEKVAIKVKKDNPIFKAIFVVDGGKTWDYEYRASKGRRKGSEQIEQTEQAGEQTEETGGKKAQDSSKNEKHGDSGRALEKAEKQIAELEKQMEGASKKTKKRLSQKIQNIRQNAQKKKKGEEHSTSKKR